MWVVELFVVISRLEPKHQPKNRKFSKWSVRPKNSCTVVRDHLEAIYAFILNIIMWVVELFVVISEVHATKAYTTSVAYTTSEKNAETFQYRRPNNISNLFSLCLTLLSWLGLYRWHRYQFLDSKLLCENIRSYISSRRAHKAKPHLGTNQQIAPISGQYYTQYLTAIMSAVLVAKALN